MNDTASSHDKGDNGIHEIPIIVIDPPVSSSGSETLNEHDDNNRDVQKGGGRLSPIAEIRASLRRNSISLPNINEMQMEYLQQLHQKALEASENGIRSDYYNSDNEYSDVEEDYVPVRVVPLRNARRKSITIAPRMLKPPRDDEDGSNSPANSITSINSLASLLREKMQMLPTTIKKKKPKDYKIRAFVAFLFLTIIFLVGVAYVLYHQKVLQKAYFEKIKFNKVTKTMKIYNAEGVNIIHSRIGTTLTPVQVHPCLPADQHDDGSFCFEWMHQARLYLHFYEVSSDVKCYNLHWISLSEGVEPTDCIGMNSATSGHWYGGGQTAEFAWPLEKGHHDFAPFVTGRVNKHQWGNVLKRYFISSKGASITIDDRTPLYTSIRDGENGKELCLRAKYDGFAFVNRYTEFPHLNYSICTSTNITRIHSAMSEKFLWDGLKKDDTIIINSLLTEPLWEITSNTKEEINETTISNTASLDLAYLKQGHVLINEFWQKNIGDFTVDTDRFPSLEESINMLHRRGFRIVFNIQTFISTESVNFAEAVRKRLLISERFSDRRIPALTRYKSVQSAGVLDVTNNQTIPWLLEKLKPLSSKYRFDAFYLDFGVAYNLPHYYHCEKTLINPDQYKSILISNLQGHVNLFGVNSAVERPRAPTFVSLPMVESSWDGMRRVIPTILTYGLIGYPLLIPGAVGGDYEVNATAVGDGNILLPDKELYVRWLQLNTFLPVIRFTHQPNTYGDQKVLEMAKILALLRQNVVSPLLKKYTNEALDSGLPLIRPLWMLEPNDPACHIVTDQFSVGEDLIVAPVLYSGAREREIYLPAGHWRDGIDGSFRKGSRWIHEYKVDENKIAFFERMPDNSRWH